MDQLGGFRYRPNLKKVIRDRHEGTQLFTQEQLPSETANSAISGRSVTRRLKPCAGWCRTAPVM